MIGKLLDLSTRHRALVLLLGLAAGGAGVVAMRNLQLDAIPDLSDPQVVVFTEWRGRSPTLVEDQVTYPLVTALLSTPRVVEVRALTMLGMSFVYVVFDEGTDAYWARSRVLERLATVRERLPEGVTPTLGPDATGVGWVYQYAVVDRTGGHDLGQLRALHDFSIRYALQSVPGVAEVATVGGFEPQYQVTVDPVRLRTYGLGLADVADAIRASNGEVGGRVVEISEREHFVRGRGYLAGTEDLERVALRTDGAGTPLLLRDVATVQVGGDLRRGAADLDGRGEVVSGVVVARYGANALDVISQVRTRLDELRRTLPPGVEIVPVYDRSSLIERAIATLTRALREEMIVVALVILLFLLHFRSALLPVVTIPLAVLIAFIPMVLLGIPATIMSLGGIAIAIGATVDAEIVMIEAAHKKLEGLRHDLPKKERERLLAEAAREVTPAIFFSLLIIAVSFVPVFGLDEQAGRLFRPLAYTKSFVMLAAALLSVTVAPALRDFLVRGKIASEAKHPVSRAIRFFYEPFVHVALRNPATTVLIGVMAVLSALPIARRLGSEFMPPLDEGDLLYMPTTLPNVSIETAKEVLQRQDAILRSFPEVESVLGKAGRADSPTDPAPLSMVETVVQLRPPSEWRTRHTSRWWSSWAPSFSRSLLAAAWPETAPMTRDDLVDEMNARLAVPGYGNAFTQPIRNRIDMQSTGIRTPVGIKIRGTDLAAIERVGEGLERVLHDVPGTRSVVFERTTGGVYVDIVPDRDALARHGLHVSDVNDLIETALGGATVTTTVEGRNRFTVNLRYAADFRSSVESIRAALVPVPGTADAGGVAPQLRLGDVADVRIVPGPPMIRDESGQLTGYVFVDLDASRDVGSYVEDARATVDAAIARHDLPRAGETSLVWSGQFEQLARMEARMKLLVPLALLVVLLLLYLQFKNLTEALIVLLSVPFALVGSVWALWLLHFHVSTAVWVGVIALVGLATQTGVVMIVYIDHAYERRMREGRIRSLEDIVEAHAEGTIQRVRPKLMTVGTMLAGLMPLLWAHGSGADVMKRIAAPMIGGLVTSAFLTLEIIPVVYTYWRHEQLVWSRLATDAPRALAVLGALRRVLAVALVVALGAAVTPLYVAVARGALVALGGAALGVATLAAATYLVVRRRALRPSPTKESLDVPA